MLSPRAGTSRRELRMREAKMAFYREEGVSIAFF
jgi:hypothetical protein